MLDDNIKLCFLNTFSNELLVVNPFKGNNNGQSNTIFCLFEIKKES